MKAILSGIEVIITDKDESKLSYRLFEDITYPGPYQGRSDLILEVLSLEGRIELLERRLKEYHKDTAP